jgi:hypothetical protein
MWSMHSGAIFITQCITFCQPVRSAINSPVGGSDDVSVNRTVEEPNRWAIRDPDLEPNNRALDEPDSIANSAAFDFTIGCAEHGSTDADANRVSQQNAFS